MDRFISYSELQKLGNKLSADLGMTSEQIESAVAFLQFSIDQTKELMAKSEQDLNWCTMQLLVGRAELLMYKLIGVGEKLNQN